MFLAQKIKSFLYVRITKEELEGAALLKQVLTTFEFWGEKPTKTIFIGA